MIMAVSMGVSGCGSSDSTAQGDTVRMWIGPELIDCEGVAPMQCMEVAYSENGETELFYDSITGLDYQEGTSYVVDVAVTEVADPPADASSLSYTLVDIVSQTPQ